MAEVISLSVVNRDWRVPCYEATGQVARCVIDSDHGAVRIGLDDEQEQYFELRGQQVGQFQRGLMVIRARGGDRRGQWSGYCYSQWGERRHCLIEARTPDAVRISYMARRTSQRQWSLEFREHQIKEFHTVLTAAIQTCHTDIAVHGQHWAEDECEQTDLMPSRSMDQAAYDQHINEMVAADAPETYAAVGEIGDRIGAMMIAYCIDFRDHFVVIGVGPDNVRGNFSSADSACWFLSAGGKVSVRLVSVTEAQAQVRAVAA
jgi:hypothetical protein